MDNDTPKRRKVDLYGMDLDHLIAQEDDPKQRVFLILLNNLNASLIDNTKATSIIGSKLDEHLTNFEVYTKDKDQLLNQGRGAWKVAAWVLGLAQVVAGVVWMDIRAELADMHVTDARMELAVSKLVGGVK